MLDRAEIIRYLGYQGQTPEPDILEMIEECVQLVEKAAEPKHVWQRFPVRIEPDCVYVGSRASLLLPGKKLAEHVKDCSEVILFAATLGIGVDRLLQKYSRLQVSKAVVIQAAAATAIEAYCDRITEELERECLSEGLFFRPRFSPGYGDLPLTVQNHFLEILQASKRTGITLTDNGMMLPEKSVTAVIGLSTTKTGCHKAGCEMCSNTGCAYRRRREYMNSEGEL